MASGIYVLGKGYHALLSLFSPKYKECYRNIQQNEVCKADIKPNKKEINQNINNSKRAMFVILWIKNIILFEELI